MPEGASGFVQYTIEIDGQVLNYRNGAANWTNFVWPNAAGTPGVRISGVTADGRTVEVFSSPGAFGFERLVDAAKVKKFANGVRELTWGEGAQAISVQYRAITTPGPATAAAATGSGASQAGLRGLKLPELVAGADTAPAPGNTASGAAR